MHIYLKEALDSETLSINETFFSKNNLVKYAFEQNE
jgi:hypothetical protein